MANGISDLHARFVNFASSMPAIAISWAQIGRDIADFVSSLQAGVHYPGTPSPSLANIPLPTYGLAYSVFVNNIDVRRAGLGAILDANIRATVHPVGRPDMVIKYYDIQTLLPNRVTLHYDQTTGDVYWLSVGGAPTITPNWYGTGPADPAVIAALQMTTIPAPQDVNFEQQVEVPLIWVTAPSFLRLVAGILPRYNLHQILPWITLEAPALFNLQSDHIIITSKRATSTVGECDPQTTVIDPDPNFPEKPVPAPTIRDPEIDFAVYARQQTFSDFFSQPIRQQVKVSESFGGIIKLELSGSSEIDCNNPYVVTQTSQGQKGIFILNNPVANMTPEIKVEIDGPCGPISQAFDEFDAVASITGEIDFDVVQRSTVGFVHGKFHVTSYTLDAADTQNQPPDPIIAQVLDPIKNGLANQEFNKLIGTAESRGQWPVLGLSTLYLKTMTLGDHPIAYAEGLAGVSGLVAVVRAKG
jgi:hypothetical protein